MEPLAFRPRGDIFGEGDSEELRALGETGSPR